MKASIIRIGNSRGIRLPKAAIESCGLKDEVELMIENGKLVLTPVHRPRDGWAEAFARVPESGDDELLDEDALEATEWDEQEWEW